MHPGNGRLWAVLIQLKKDEPVEERWRVFHLALKEVLFNPCTSVAVVVINTTYFFFFSSLSLPVPLL